MLYAIEIVKERHLLELQLEAEKRNGLHLMFF